MRHLSLPGLALIAFAAGAACTGKDPNNASEGASDSSEYLFAPEKLLEFSVEIPPASLGPISAEADPDGNCKTIERQYYQGALEFEGTRFEGVGVRAKGGCGSSRPLDEKSGLKIHLSWDNPAVIGCVEKRELYGQRKLTFNNAAQDDSLTHDSLTYDYFRQLGLPAPRVAQVRLNVNGEYWGLYNLVESIERPFLKRSFAEHRGMMWEGAYGCDLVPNDVTDSRSCFELEFDQDECDGAPDPNEDPRDYSLLAELARKLDAIPDGQFLEGAAAHFNIDLLLTYWAAERITGHWDGYFGRIVNNYRVYHQPAEDLFHFIPWGADQAFRDNTDVFEGHNVIAERCLSEPDCKARFTQQLRSSLQVFEQMDLEAELTRLELKLAPLIEEERRGGPSRREWQEAIDETRSYISKRPTQISEQIDDDAPP